MARLPRVIIPGLPHHVTQRGVRSITLFRTTHDHLHYLALLRKFTRRFRVKIWAWCLMSNHVHMVLVPPREDALARAIGEAHRRFTLHVNQREGVRGHLFQERFHSFPIQTDRHLLAVVRYVECNPVRANLVRHAEAYRWSSARHRVLGRSDPLLAGHLPVALDKSWRAFLAEDEQRDERQALQRHARTGRPWGSASWIKELERKTKRRLSPRKRGWPRGRSRQRSGAN